MCVAGPVAGPGTRMKHGKNKKSKSHLLSRKQIATELLVPEIDGAERAAIFQSQNDVSAFAVTASHSITSPDVEEGSCGRVAIHAPARKDSKTCYDLLHCSVD